MATGSVISFIEMFNGPETVVRAHTSGSTGTPKEVWLPKSDMVVSAEATCRYFGITERSVIAAPLSIDYIAGKMMVVRGIVSGARVELLEPSNRPDLSVIDAEIDLLAVVPSQVPYVLANHAGRIGSLLVGGAAMPGAVERLAESAPMAVYVSYGMTETCSHVALRRIGGDGLYHAMPSVSFDTDGRGCLVICSDSYSFGRLVTNDMVRLSGTQAFEWIGRYDNVINSGGMKIHPETVERCLSSHIDKPLYITGEPDDKWGTRVVLHIEDADNLTDTDALRELCRRILPEASVPRSIVVDSCFHRTSSGKIIRK